MRQRQNVGGARWEDKGTDKLTASCSNDLPEGCTAVTGQFSASLKPCSPTHPLLHSHLFLPECVFLHLFTHLPSALFLLPVIWLTPLYGNQWTPNHSSSSRLGQKEEMGNFSQSSWFYITITNEHIHNTLTTTHYTNKMLICNRHCISCEPWSIPSRLLCYRLSCFCY